RRRRQPLFRLSRGRRRDPRYRRFGLDGQRGGGNREARPHPRPAGRRRQVRAVSRGDARSRHHPPVSRGARSLELCAARRHRPRRRRGARIGAGAARAGGLAVKGAAIYLVLVVTAAAVFLLAPGIDIAVSGWFYTPRAGFAAGDLPVLRLFAETIPLIARLIAAVVAVGILWLVLAGRPLWRLDRKALAFIALATALGPGLL